jgi:hypothetical protein
MLIPYVSTLYKCLSETEARIFPIRNKCFTLKNKALKWRLNGTK